MLVSAGFDSFRIRTVSDFMHSVKLVFTARSNVSWCSMYLSISMGSSTACNTMTVVQSLAGTGAGVGANAVQIPYKIHIVIVAIFTWSSSGETANALDEWTILTRNGLCHRLKYSFVPHRKRFALWRPSQFRICVLCKILIEHLQIIILIQPS